MQIDYSWQYLQTCDQLVQSFLKDAVKTNTHVFTIKNINVEKAVANDLWEFIFLSKYKEVYSRNIQTGCTEKKNY